MRKILGLALAGLLLSSGVSLGQSALQPAKVLSTSTAGTITASNVFQKIWDGSLTTGGQGSLRSACLIINTSTHQQWVYFDRTGNAELALGDAALKAASVPLNVATLAAAAGGSVDCGSVSVSQDTIWITGTSGDTFTAIQR